MKKGAFTDPAFFGETLHVQVATLSAWFATVLDGSHEFTMEGARAFTEALDFIALECRTQELELTRLRAQVAHLQQASGVAQGKGGSAAAIGGEKVIVLDAFRKHPLLPSTPGGAA